MGGRLNAKVTGFHSLLSVTCGAASAGERGCQTAVRVRAHAQRACEARKAAHSAPRAAACGGGKGVAHVVIAAARADLAVQLGQVQRGAERGWDLDCAGRRRAVSSRKLRTPHAAAQGRAQPVPLSRWPLFLSWKASSDTRNKYSSSSFSPGSALAKGRTRRNVSATSCRRERAKKHAARRSRTHAPGLRWKRALLALGRRVVQET